ncbi:ATP-binding protein [Terriglobus sp. YAF25]|uniref:ATP-binding protein n=1 Tax=Terriglobus sp. YAF25 TaxID=3233080 RepID=UPI003F97494D
MMTGASADHQAVFIRQVFHVEDGDNAVRDARERIAAIAAAWRVPLSRAALGDVKLCATEIITNALTHAGGECWVTAEWTGSHLEVAVRDRSLRPPVVVPFAHERESG